MIWVLYWFIAGLASAGFWVFLHSKSTRKETNGHILMGSLGLVAGGFVSVFICLLAVVMTFLSEIAKTEWWNKR